MLKDHDEKNPRRWPVERMLDHVGLPADAPWAAAFVQHVGHWSHFNHTVRGGRSSWPFPRVGTLEEIHAYAAERGVVADTPMLGDIALFRARVEDEYLQGGIVVDVIDFGKTDGGVVYHDCLTIEGDTDVSGALHGALVSRVRRRFLRTKDCFVRWVELDSRGVSATPWERTERIAGRVRLAPAA